MKHTHIYIYIDQVYRFNFINQLNFKRINHESKIDKERKINK